MDWITKVLYPAQNRPGIFVRTGGTALSYMWTMFFMRFGQFEVAFRSRKVL